MNGTHIVCLLALLATGVQGEGIGVSSETWDWPAAMLSVARRFEGREGMVLPMGDSNTYANQAGRWARQGEGRSEEELAICRWMRSHEDGPDNGWWLAADDQPEGRSWTAASGCTSGEYLAGGKGGLPALDEILTRHNPQVASILLGTNDLRAGVSPERFLGNNRGDLRALPGQWHHSDRADAAAHDVGHERESAEVQRGAA